jgi:hypothetical protein
MSQQGLTDKELTWIGLFTRFTRVAGTPSRSLVRLPRRDQTPPIGSGTLPKRHTTAQNAADLHPVTKKRTGSRLKKNSVADQPSPDAETTSRKYSGNAWRKTSNCCTPAVLAPSLLQNVCPTETDVIA